MGEGDSIADAGRGDFFASQKLLDYAVAVNDPRLMLFARKRRSGQLRPSSFPVREAMIGTRL